MKLPGRSRMIRDAAEKGGQKWYLEILIFLGVFAVASFLEGIPQAIGQFLLIAQTGELFPKVYPDWFMIVSLVSTALMTVAVVLFCKLVQKRDLPSVGFCRKGAVKEYLIGAAAGAGLFRKVHPARSERQRRRATRAPRSFFFMAVFLSHKGDSSYIDEGRDPSVPVLPIIFPKTPA